MGTVLLLVKLFIPVVSAIGIAFCLSRNEKIGLRFAPLFSACGIVTVLFVSGILNVLHLAVWAVMAFGLGCFVYYGFLYIKEKNFLFFIHPVWIYIGVMFALLILLFKDAAYADTDEYSHWGTMIKEMISVNGFPDARTVIDYKEYPPAAALFMFFIMKLTGFSQSISYMAQGLFAVMALSCLFKNEGFKQPVEVVKSAVLTAVVLGLFSQTFHTLLVEYVIGIFAIALLVYINENRGWIAEDVLTGAKYLAPVMITLTLVKTNAVVFYVMALMVLGVIIYNKRKADKAGPLMLMEKGRLAKTLGLLASPVICLFFWTAYIKKVYLGRGYATVKFALTKENLLKNYTEKPDWIIDKVYSEFIRSLYTQPRALVVIVTFVLAVALIIAGKKKLGADTGKLTRATAVSLALWVVYCIGYVFMLLFLMPYWEMDEGARILIGYDRYMAVPAAVICAYILYCRFDMLGRAEINKLISAGLCAVMVAATLPFLNKTVFINRAEKYMWANDLLQFQSQVANIPVLFDRDDDLLIYLGDKDDTQSIYNNHIFEKEFLNRNIKNFTNTKIDGYDYTWTDGRLKKLLNDAEFIIILDSSDKIVNIIAENGLEFAYDPARSIYSVVKNEDGMAIRIEP